MPVIVSRAPYYGFAAELPDQQDAWLLSAPGDDYGVGTAVQTLLADASLRLRLLEGGKQQASCRTRAIATLKYEKIILT